jgi:hypothetical protein
MSESVVAADLLDTAIIRRGFEPETCAMDKGYDLPASTTRARPGASDRSSP